MIVCESLTQSISQIHFLQASSVASLSIGASAGSPIREIIPPLKDSANTALSEIRSQMDNVKDVTREMFDAAKTKMFEYIDNLRLGQAPEPDS